MEAPIKNTGKIISQQAQPSIERVRMIVKKNIIDIHGTNIL